MKLLAVDTALGACSAAILDGTTVLAHALEPMERGHAERLAPMVQEAMNKAGMSFDAIERLAVTIGPGTFTGQRVGYAFMRGLRLALGRPLIGITTLAAMAQAAMAETGARAAAVLHDAKRGEVYFTLVAGNHTLISDRLAAFDDALGAIAANSNHFDGRLAMGGTAAGNAAQALVAQGYDVAQSEVIAPDALWVARLALVAAEPQTVPRPLYLRPPDARLPARSP
ncbi:MAG TPA: tRNA (adenosine(37)-N6)-threonylcarbamoyltransferase complex dimerization subunit type 1 TsaB [Rhizomicrobium sp.]|nr:tRNA (adenosine(37)-N6)-threonylcarbamoyltransferase complex dimerization subunit type 1 TsaB [Rhizomicrobium sp.]